MQPLFSKITLLVFSLLVPGQATSEGVFSDGMILFAPPAEVGGGELSLHALAAETSRAEARAGELLDRYQRIRVVQSWGGQSARARLFDALSANHVHGPSCIHFYQSDYAAVAVPPDIGRDAEKARQVLEELRRRVSTLQGRVTALERGLARSEGDLADQ